MEKVRRRGIKVENDKKWNSIHDFLLKSSGSIEGDNFFGKGQFIPNNCAALLNNLNQISSGALCHQEDFREIMDIINAGTKSTLG